MTGLSTDMKNRIAEVLDSTHFTQHGFTMKYDDESDAMAIIALSGSPEYRFVINSTSEGAFSTSESPGIGSDAAETFQRNNFELCMNAMRCWVGRIIDEQKDWMLDEFGGVADRNPSLGRKE